MIFKDYFGWEENGKFYLSVFPPDRAGPRNEYATREEAIAEANRRGGTITWR